MMVVADASVCIKWFFRESRDEQDLEQAIRLLLSIRSGNVTLVQPFHWLSEVVAVITRVRPEIAEPAIDYLSAMNIKCRQDAEILKRAAQLSQTFTHHLFDTVYHAVALHHNALLITADKKYFRKARSAGNIQLLSQWKEA